MASTPCQYANFGTALFVRKIVKSAFLIAALPIILASSTSFAQATLSGINKIAAGKFHTCVTTTGGAVKCWGDNYGKLGDNSETNRLTPVDAVGLASGVASIAAGDGQTCVVTATRGVKCMGYTWQDLVTRSLVAVDVQGLTTGVAGVGSGEAHTCVLTTGGAMKCWGRNGNGLTGYGQLGNNSTADSFTPVDAVGLTSGVSAITLGATHTCALTAAGGVKCWGNAEFGRLGTAAGSNSLVPGDVVGLTSGVTAIDAGALHNCALKTGGTVRCWGYDGSGQLGAGVAGGDVVGLGNAIAVQAGGLHSCALTAGGAVKCWGDNSYGQLGNNSTTQSNMPVDVVGLGSGVSAIALGFEHSCAVMSSGGVKCWGHNTYGMLGDGSVATRLTPVDVLATRVPPKPGNDFDGDGKTDFVLTHTSGAIYLYLRAAPTPDATFVPIAGAGSGYSIKRIADFNGDGKPDVMLENTNGSTVILLINGGAIASAAYLVGPGGAWKVAQVGDFNGDGKADVILRHTDGSLYVALMNGTSIISGAYLTSGNAWTAQAVADLNGDGKADIVLKHADGSLYGLIMNGTAVAGGAYITSGNTWDLQLTGDFNGDGKTDIVLSNPDGRNIVLLMNGATATSAAYLTEAGGFFTWSAVAGGDVNGDGKTDIVLKNNFGGYALLLMDGTTVIRAGLLVDPGYELQAVGDFNGDGRADIAMRDIHSFNARNTYAFYLDPYPGVAGYELIAGPDFTVSP